MSARLRETKAMNARNAEILRGMLKKPDNKFCVDCKRNDARWASTNLGVFLCIRCSGIHRGLGVHISRVRSVDLDTWSPEQIANMEKWGNAKANIYWEAHLKAGHQPPEHKMEQFIRSKYESKRWAMEGPVPDPATLGDSSTSAAAVSTESTSTPAPSVKSPAAASSKPSPFDLLGGGFNDSPSSSQGSKAAASLAYPSPPSARATPTPATSANQSAVSAPPSSKPPSGPTAGSLFDLDFNAVGPSTSGSSGGGAQRKNANDIMSLFGSPSAAPAAPASSTYAGHGNSGNGLDAFASLSLGGQGGSTTQNSSSMYSSTQPNMYTTSATPASQQQNTNAFGSGTRAASQSNPWSAVDSASAAPAGSAYAQTSANFYSGSSASSTAPSSKPPTYSSASNDFGAGFAAKPATGNNYTTASSQNGNNHGSSSMDFFNSQDIWGNATNTSTANSKTTANDPFGGFSSGSTAKNSGGFDDLWS